MDGMLIFVVILAIVARLLLALAIPCVIALLGLTISALATLFDRGIGTIGDAIVDRLSGRKARRGGAVSAAETAVVAGEPKTPPGLPEGTAATKGPVDDSLIQAEAESHTGRSITQVYVPAETPDPMATERKRLWRRRIALGGMALFLISLLSVVAIEMIGVEPILRWAMSDLKPKTGIELTFDRVTGSFLRGHLEATGITLKRDDGDASHFDLQCRRAECDFSLWTVLWSKTAFDVVKVDQITGRYERAGEKEERLAKKSFEIKKLIVTNSDIQFIDHTVKGEPARLAVRVDSFECNRLRSRWVLFDTMFRSNIAGTLEGRPLTITSRATDAGRDVRWNVEQLPIAVAGYYFGGPFRWLERGTIDVDVSSRVPVAGQSKTKPQAKSKTKSAIAMDWRQKLHDVRPKLPDELNSMNPVAQRLAHMAVEELNRRVEGLEVSFDVNLDLSDGRVELTGDEFVHKLWAAIANRAVAALLEKLGANPDDVKSVSWEGLTSALKDNPKELIEKGKALLKEGIDKWKGKFNPNKSETKPIKPEAIPDK